MFHNLSGYDSHLFIKHLAKNGEEINCISNNEKKYISFSKEVVVDDFVNKEGKQVQVELKKSLYLRHRSTDRDEISQELADCYCKAFRMWKFAYFKSSKWRKDAILGIWKSRYFHNRSTDRDEILYK